MSRMGHDSMQAAIGYQHATAAADARIAAALEAALNPMSRPTRTTARRMTTMTTAAPVRSSRSVDGDFVAVRGPDGGRDANWWTATSEGEHW